MNAKSHPRPTNSLRLVSRQTCCAEEKQAHAGSAKPDQIATRVSIDYVFEEERVGDKIVFFIVR